MKDFPENMTTEQSLRMMAIGIHEIACDVKNLIWLAENSLPYEPVMHEGERILPTGPLFEYTAHLQQCDHGMLMAEMCGLKKDLSEMREWNAESIERIAARIRALNESGMPPAKGESE